MAETFTRAFWLFYAVTFIVLIPASIYEVLKEGLPKIILVICIPAYAFLSRGSYHTFQNQRTG
jgi:hypothetical protein